jgi:hypothetical protein
MPGKQDQVAERQLRQALAEFCRHGGRLTVPPWVESAAYAARTRRLRRCERWMRWDLLGAGFCFAVAVVLTLLGLPGVAQVFASLVFAMLLGASLTGLLWLVLWARRVWAAERPVITVVSQGGVLTFPAVDSSGKVVDPDTLVDQLWLGAEVGDELLVSRECRDNPMADGDPLAPETRRWQLTVARVTLRRQRALTLWREAADRVAGVSRWRDRPELVALERDVRSVVVKAFGEELRAGGYDAQAQGPFRSDVPAVLARLPEVPPPDYLINLDAWFSGALSQCRYGHAGPHEVAGFEEFPDDDGARRIRLECRTPGCRSRWTEKVLP